VLTHVRIDDARREHRIDATRLPAAVMARSNEQADSCRQNETMHTLLPEV
jgi:hypothetical protein